MRRVTNWDDFHDFKKVEFDHGGPEMSLGFMQRLQRARDISKGLCHALGIEEIPFIITSGSRSEDRNRQVGGMPDSAHLYGCACDIKTLSSRESFIIMKSLILAGFTRIGLYKGYIHVDTQKEKAQQVLFT